MTLSNDPIADRQRQKQAREAVHRLNAADIRLAQRVSSREAVRQSGISGNLGKKRARRAPFTIANTTGLQTALDGKAALAHTHAITDTTGLQTALDARALKASTVLNPVASQTPASNGDLVFERTNDTTLTIKLKGQDATVRSIPLTLA